MINIVVNSSNEYSTYCGVMLTSLFENNKDYKFSVYIFSTFIDAENQKRLFSLKEKYHQDIIIKIVDDSSLKSLPIYFGYHNMAVYLRVMAAELLPQEVTKFIYLDCDIIINGDISELWNIDISDYALAATKDLPRFEPTYVKNLNLAPNEYFNSGVMLVNTIYWRENHIAAKVFDFAKNNNKKIIACDQDAMNAVFSKTGKVLLIKRKWNVYPDVFFESPDLYTEEMNEVSSIREQPIVIHFMYKKPWFSDCIHPYKELFYKYYAEYTGQKFIPIHIKHTFLQKVRRLYLYILMKLHIKKIYNVYDVKYEKGVNRITW